MVGHTELGRCVKDDSGPSLFMQESRKNTNEGIGAIIIISETIYLLEKEREKKKKSDLETAMETMKPLEVCVKAAVCDPNALGNCPCSQTVLMMLEEKYVPYNKKLIDVNHMPQWFREISPEGKVPALKIDNKWIFDSDVITDMLDDRYPIPPLASPPEFSSLGSKIMPLLARFLKSTDQSDGSEKALVDELQVLDEHLKVHGPYVDGDDVTSIDLFLAPKLYHMETVLSHFKNWTIPKSLKYVENYCEMLFSRLTFIKTHASPDCVISGWEAKLQ
ncbi:glutathione S-transferase DHAR2-like isoform X1 [Magnolia sinica]|uniref:glutathione S-transferase DHAR2-like isoform X1 n=1 Tax=Magnolia sinica TaxID=86752 RepID=UPI00265B54D2|nr:glutathione S-transferase DHAR2-like isoform X1 [Magnolia sinica]